MRCNPVRVSLTLSSPLLDANELGVVCVVAGVGATRSAEPHGSCSMGVSGHDVPPLQRTPAGTGPPLQRLRRVRAPWTRPCAARSLDTLSVGQEAPP